MLKEENLWEVLLDDEKGECSNTQVTKEVVMLSPWALAEQFVRQLPIYPKKTLFLCEFAQLWNVEEEK